MLHRLSQSPFACFLALLGLAGICGVLLYLLPLWIVALGYPVLFLSVLGVELLVDRYNSNLPPPRP